VQTRQDNHIRSSRICRGARSSISLPPTCRLRKGPSSSSSFRNKLACDEVDQRPLGRLAVVLVGVDQERPDRPRVGYAPSPCPIRCRPFGLPTVFRGQLAYEWRKRISDARHGPGKAMQKSFARIRESRNEGALWRYGRELLEEALKSEDAAAPISFLRGFPLPEASAAEDAFHAVVGLVAGVLEEQTFDDS
jgi:hypothetical protein